MFPFRKKPPTKAEVLKHRVARGLIDFGKKLDKTPVPEVHLPEVHLPEVHIDVEAARRQARAGALQAAQVAGQALHDASGRAEAVGGLARDRARELAGNARESAQGALAAASDRAGRAAGQAGQALQEAAQGALATAGDRAGQASHALQEAAQGALATASDRAGRAANQAGHTIQDAAQSAGTMVTDAAHQASDQAGRALHDAAQGAGEAIGKLRDKAVRTSQGPRISIADREVRVSESSSKWLWIALGLLAGGFAALIFLPAAGRRSRGVRERLDSVREGKADAVTTASDKAAELERGPGPCAEDETLADEANDALLTDRVQAVLGQLPALEHIEGLNVQIEKGVVILRGNAPSEADCLAITSAARAVPGVKDVRSEFKTDKVVA